MVIPPILGEALLDLIKAAHQGFDAAFAGISSTTMLIGFNAALFSGILACKWMIGIVKKGKLIYFAYYCAVVGILTLLL